MPTLLNPAQIREHYNTDASDDAIQRFLDAEDAAILRLLGSPVEQTDYFFYPQGPIVLTRPAISISSITEDDELLSSDLYELRDGYRVLYRLGGMFDDNYLLWGDRTTVVYVPYNDTAERVRALQYLVGIGLAQNGYQVERNTEILHEPKDYQAERVKTLRSLTRFPRFA